MIAAVVFGTFVFLAFLSVPILASITIAGATGIIILGFGDKLELVSQQMLDGINNSALLSVPFFILAGNLLNALQLTERIFQFATNLVGHIRAGLAQVNILASLLFSGISGAAVADCAALGTVEVKAMRERGYKSEFAAALTAASSIIGPIFPPSIPLLIYAFVTSSSVGRLFLAGIIPALLLVAGLMIFVYVLAHKQNLPREKRATRSEVLNSAADGLFVLMAPAIILVAMLSGITTASEAGVLACCYALMLGVYYKTLTIRSLYQALRETAYLSAIVLLMIGFSTVIAWIMAFTQVPQGLAALMLQNISADWQFILIYIVFFLLIGCIFDGLSAMIIMMPIVLPIVDSFGIDRVHFGIVTVLTLMVGILTPPLGIALYVMMDIAKLPFETIARATIPFLFPIVAVIVLIAFIPEITLFLPNLIMGPE